ncbi:hypothetical protein [Flavobacterium acetivorans]|uniref:hypothetical protein n=1 Tax=Flavobacterium acetivorans TaxID=2893883 RepID=UPI001E5A4818|nr:hypothetical protein [Flavobacterium sp. F-29]UFH34546.1 hypothetical protein LNP19_10630 [Flavobacterium sp. F-29]
MKKTYIKNIDEALLDSIKEGDSTYINNVLTDEGIDLDKMNIIAEKNVKKILFLAKAKANKIHNDRLLQVALTLKEGIEKGLEKPISVIKNLIASNELSFQFRNLDRLGETEIKEIIKGHNLLNILEELENNDEDPAVK